MPTFKDQLERTFTITQTPKRIVSLVPSQTELLVDLGLRAFLVGITKFCAHPKDLRKSTAIVGGTKSIKLEKIKVLQPDIILCNKEENTEAIVDALEGIAPIHISDIQSLEDVHELIAMYGGLFQVEKKANCISALIKEERQAFQSFIKNRPKPKAAYFIWKNPWMVAGGDTFIHTMLGEAGFENSFAHKLRYPEITLDDGSFLDTAYILLSSEPFPFKDKHLTSFKALFSDKKISIVDGEMFSWYGSRLQHAYAYFKSFYVK